MAEQEENDYLDIIPDASSCEITPSANTFVELQPTEDVVPIESSAPVRNVVLETLDPIVPIEACETVIADPTFESTYISESTDSEYCAEDILLAEIKAAITPTTEITYIHPDHTGDVNSDGDGATIIVNGAVTNLKLAPMQPLSLKGNNLGSLGSAMDLTTTQVRSLLNVEDGAQVNVPTDLSLVVTATEITVYSSTGTDIILPLATNVLSGLVDPTDKVKWDQSFDWGDHTGLYTPLNRSLTINGVTYDLTADRTWTIPTVTSLAALTDVALTVLNDNQLLKYDATTGKWINWTNNFLTSFTEVDPIFTAHAAFNVTNIRITNWDNAFNWGNHAGLYSLLGHIHDDRYYTETEINSFFSGATAINGYNKTNWDNTFASLGNYLLLTGGTLSGALIGTTATFSSTTVTNIGTSGYNLTTNLPVGAGLTARNIAGHSVIQVGNNLYSSYTGVVDTAYAGAMIRLDTRNGSGSTSYGGEGYTAFNIQMRGAGSGTHTIPFQIVAGSPNGAFILKNTGLVQLNYGMTSTTGVFTDVVTGVTAATADNSTKFATTAYVKNQDFVTASSTHTFTNKSGNISQWTNNVGYITGYTETDPTVPAYAKSLSSFSIIQGSTDALYPTKTGGGASGTWAINISGNAATASTSSQVTVNYGNDSNGNYYMIWGSGNTLYGTNGVYLNPANDNIYATSFNGNWNGYTLATGATASTVVLRDASGHITGNYGFYGYLNSSDNIEASATYFIIKNGDNYHRSITPATTAVLVRNNASGTWPIDISGNASYSTYARYIYQVGTYGGTVGYVEASSLQVYYSSISRNVYNNGAYGGTVGYVEPSSLYVAYAYYGRLAYNNGAYSGSGWVEPSDLGVRYAASAGNADTVDGQHFAWSNNSNSPLYLWAADSNGSGYLAARASMSVNYASSAGSASSASLASTVTINYNNDSDSNYQLLWGSGNSVYGTAGVYLNPAADAIYANNFYANGGWFRNTGQTGLYNQTYAGHFYQEGTNYWTITGGNVQPFGLVFRATYQSTISGYIYASNSNFGILHSGGGWAVMCYSGGGNLEGAWTVGSITASSGGYESDLTLKNVLSTDVSDRYIGDKVTPITYRWKDQEKDQTLRFGYGAQDIQKLIPEAVYKVSKGTLAVDYTQIHTLLIDENTKRIQELEREVQELKRRLE